MANSLLFLSSLLLLIDVTPRDFFSAQRQRIQALTVLRVKHNILGMLPANVRIRPETSGMEMVTDPEVYQTLLEAIRERGRNIADVSWSEAVGVGYASISLPVAGNKLDAFHPLYVVQLPPDQSDRLILMPVGQLEELEAWVAERRQTSVTRWALVLLAIGFLLQLAASANSGPD